MYRMTMNRPSSWWGGLYRESIPLGNGLTGAMVYGGAVFERIVLTHARCWRGATSSKPMRVSLRKRPTRPKPNALSSGAGPDRSAPQF